MRGFASGPVFEGGGGRGRAGSAGGKPRRAGFPGFGLLPNHVNCGFAFFVNFGFVLSAAANFCFRNC